MLSLQNQHKFLSDISIYLHIYVIQNYTYFWTPTELYNCHVELFESPFSLKPELFCYLRCKFQK